ncbi:MAG: hypothetical protein RLY20_2899 [Verrucomicrobiota bacterium]|jgi:DNA-directed RNA polymerase subunit RPC12/RpoP
MRDLKFACSHCEQHIKCTDEMAGRTIPCPACGQEVVVPKLPDEHHLRITTGKVPVPTHAHGAPRATETMAHAEAPAPMPRYSAYAIASLALSCGSLLIGPFGCTLGIIFGHLAKAELQRNPRLLGAELVKAGLLIGYCFLAMFALLGMWITLKLVKGH